MFCQFRYTRNYRTARSGDRCANFVVSGSNYCRAHTQLSQRREQRLLPQDNERLCLFRNGSRSADICSRPAIVGSIYCVVHETISLQYNSVNEETTINELFDQLLNFPSVNEDTPRTLTPNEEILTHRLPSPTLCIHCGASRWLHESEVMCCNRGKLHDALQPWPRLPEIMRNFLSGDSAQAREFQRNIRLYNNLLAFASCHSNVDPRLLNRRHTGVYSFRINGAIYHRISDINPDVMNSAFGEIYIHDPAEQLQRRMNIQPSANQTILQSLQTMILSLNPIAMGYRMLGDTQLPNLNLRIDSVDPIDGRRLIQTADEIAVFIPSQHHHIRSVILRQGRDSSNFYTIDENHGCFNSLVYPIIFPSGCPGWTPDLIYPNGQSITLLSYYRYHLMFREFSSDYFRMGRLFHQFVVDVYARIESSRLRFLRLKQDEFRRVRGLTDSDTVLPSSFTGGPRYMREKFHDSMAIMRQFGMPTLFLTMTTNPEWPEISENLLNNQTWNERPDLVVRVFRLKLRLLLQELKSGRVFGNPTAIVHTIEFQKRGLPHAHILLFLPDQLRPQNSDDVDGLVTAELPDPIIDARLYLLVKKHMIHRPCSTESACWKGGSHCSKYFPKVNTDITYREDNGFWIYRRRLNTDHLVPNNSISNSWVVPYNKYLLLKYTCHLNVEVCCNSTNPNMIKYLFKYIHKGPDSAIFNLSNDEIQQFLVGRYISATESFWRIYEFPIAEQRPSVMRLSIHLENELPLEDDEDILNRATTLTQWLLYNRENPTGQNKTLLYHEFPGYYVFNRQTRLWNPRRERPAVGRIYYISSAMGELYYLRLLLHEIRGASSFEELRTIRNALDGSMVLYNTYKDAAIAARLAINDNEFYLTLQETMSFSTGRQMRYVFALLLSYADISNPRSLWEYFLQGFCDDILYREYSMIDYRLRPQIITPEVERLALRDLASILNSMNRNISCYNLPFTASMRHITENIYNIDTDLLNEQISNLNPDQRHIYEEVMMEVVQPSSDRLFFIHGIGGTGKTFLYQTILRKLRSEGKHVVALATTGIAATLLDGGQTAHSFFGISVDFLPGDSLSPSLNARQLLIRSDLILIDEATMIRRSIFESIHTLCSELCNNDAPFGNKLIVLGGDWHQTLPVMPHAQPEEIISQTIKTSRFWRNVRHRILSHNMRLTIDDLPWKSYLTRIAKGQPPNERVVTIPEDIILSAGNDDAIELMMDFVYRESSGSNCILAILNEDVNRLNSKILSLQPGRELVSRSIDICEENVAGVTPEMLHQLNPPGMPLSEFQAKVGSPLIILRNLNQSQNLCNGTIVKLIDFTDRTLKVRIMRGRFAGREHVIPKISLCSKPGDYAFTFKRYQFPVSLAYSITVNKSQGQTFDRVGIWLTHAPFAHGQLYVALSRSKSREGVKVYLPDNRNYTTNVVYQAVIADRPNI